MAFTVDTRADCTIQVYNSKHKIGFPTELLYHNSTDIYKNSSALVLWLQRLGHYLLHISFSSPACMLFWDPLHWPLLYILPISRSVRVDAADLHVDLLLSEVQNS